MANYTPSIDAGYGLIYRLNILWQNIDQKAIRGDLEGWNFSLDRVYCNLLYRDDIVVRYKDKEEKEIQDISLSKKESKIYDKFRELIRNVKVKMINSIKNKRRGDYNSANEEYYRILMKKDIWLRKLMQQRNLYLKEVEFNPARAMFGG